MNATTLNTAELTRTAIDSLKNAYDESTNIQARQFIATAYTAVTLLKSVFGKNESDEDMDSDVDPSEYCAAI